MTMSNRPVPLQTAWHISNTSIVSFFLRLVSLVLHFIFYSAKKVVKFDSVQLTEVCSSGQQTELLSADDKMVRQRKGKCQLLLLTSPFL